MIERTDDPRHQISLLVYTEERKLEKPLIFVAGSSR